MVKRPQIAAALLLPLLLAAAPAGAADEDKSQGKRTHLHLQQSAERQVKRDRLRVVLRAEQTGPDARQVQADVNKAMAAAIEKAKAVRGITVESGGYSVWQERAEGKPPRWRASQNVTLTSPDFPALLTLAGQLQADGLAASDMGYELSPEAARNVEDELTAQALKRLRDRAERVAADLQMELLRFRDVRVGNVDSGPQPILMKQRAVMAAAAAPPPVDMAGEGGDATVRVNVEAEALLGPSDQSRP